LNRGLWLAPLISLILFALPIPVSPEGHRMLAIVGLAVTLWISEALPLPVTALLIGVLTILFGIGSASEVFSTFADPIAFLFIGSFILAEAMQLHRLDQRVAGTILRSGWVRAKAGRMFFIYSCISFAISMWISNTATTAMMYPIGLSIIHIFPEEERPPVAHLVLLMTSFGASIGGMATPVGTPPNLIGIGFIKSLTNQSVPFLEWMGFAIPISLAIFFCIYAAMRFFHLGSNIQSTSS
jgi:sodium-dependent dicarboxylate transporter 2/3/5